MRRPRALKRHNTQRVINNRVKLMKNKGYSYSVEDHYFHKHHPLNCGNTQCGLCRSSASDMKYYEKYKRDYLGEHENDLYSEYEYYLYLKSLDSYYNNEYEYDLSASNEDIEEALARSNAATASLLKVVRQLEAEGKITLSLFSFKCLSMVARRGHADT